MSFPLLNVTPTGHFSDGQPIYEFLTSLPTRGVHLLRLPGGLVDERDTPAEAQMAGEHYVRMQGPFGERREMIGITRRTNNKYAAVVNRHQSNT